VQPLQECRGTQGLRSLAGRLRDLLVGWPEGGASGRLHDTVAARAPLRAPAARPRVPGNRQL